MCYYAVIDTYVKDKETGRRAWKCLEFGTRTSGVESVTLQERRLAELFGHAIQYTLKHEAPYCTSSQSDTAGNASEKDICIQVEVPAGSRLFQQETVRKEHRFFDDGWLYYTVDGNGFCSENAVRWGTDNF